MAKVTYRRAVLLYCSGIVEYFKLKYIVVLVKVVLPPPVHFWKYADVWPYKTYGGKPHTICMGETESRPIWPYLPYKIHADHPRGRREEYGPEARPVRHRRPHDLCGGACRVGWSSMAAEVGKSHVYSSPAAPPCIQYERGENPGENTH